MHNLLRPLAHLLMAYAANRFLQKRSTGRYSKRDPDLHKQIWDRSNDD